MPSINRSDARSWLESSCRVKNCVNRYWPSSTASASPVRDALLRLERENLMTVLPRQGYRVKPISFSEIQDVFALRLLIEPACAQAAAWAHDTALRALDRFRGFVEQDDTESECVEYDRSFHHALADLSGNQRMGEIVRPDGGIRAPGAGRPAHLLSRGGSSRVRGARSDHRCASGS